jgi:AraC-like DNA-binding protein
MHRDIFREITPLTGGDCFLIFSRHKTRFDFPVHRHHEIELTLILNAAGAKRVVGDHEEEITDVELVMTGPNLAHGWISDRDFSDGFKEVTIQFQPDFVSDGLLNRNQLYHIRKLFDSANRGVAFSEDTVRSITPRLLALKQKSNFDSVIEFFSIIHDLSVARNSRILSPTALPLHVHDQAGWHIEKIFDYMNNNFSRRLTAPEVARAGELNLHTFNRIVKKCTGHTYNDCLSEIRLGHVCRMLIQTTHTVAEIAYACGFNNLANFNRIFLKKKQCTPTAFRNSYAGNGTFV